ncbi:MAG: M23 family metallopeptidase [Chloroflexi bacterium]|nr:M23 family metallopeptidase [Chloroflexota bacterium]
MKGIFRFSLVLMVAPLFCGTAFVIGYVILVALTIPQLPAWAQPAVTQWLLDIPQHAESSDNGAYGLNGSSSPAGLSAVQWDGYIGTETMIHGLPIIDRVQLWSVWYDKPLLGCLFHDPRYESHTGSDFPMNEGTPIHTTISGKVVWAAENGPWGNLVVVENDGYQIWLAHLSSIEVSEGDILEYGDEIGLSGNTGNSTGGHLHYGIKHKTEAGSYVWLDPQLFFNEDEYIYIGCSD